MTDPTQGPTPDPTDVPPQGLTPDPTHVPPQDPTQDPTEDPTQSPTQDPTPAHVQVPTPAPRYSYPGGPPAAADRGVGLSEATESTPTRRPAGRRTGLVVGGVVAALVLGGGAVFAVQQLSGGGAQPADVLPGDSYGYLRLDIDPSAGQKIAAVRFLDKLPQVRDTLGGGDPRKKLWDLVAQATAAGELDLPREDILFFGTPHAHEVSVNSTRVAGALSVASESPTPRSAAAGGVPG